MDPINDDPFCVLGFLRDGTASEDELRRAYKTLALKCHPDRVDPTSTDEQKEAAHHEFARISEAYQTCTDKVKLYDWRQQQEDLKKEARYHRAREARAGPPGAAAGASSAASVATAPDARGRGVGDRRGRSKSPGLFGRGGGGRNSSPSQRSVRTTWTGGRSRSPGPLKNNNNVSPTSNKPQVPKARFMPFSSPKKQHRHHPTAKNPSAPWQRQKQEHFEDPVVPPPPPISTTPISRQKARSSSPKTPTRRNSNPSLSTARLGSPSRPNRPRSKSPGPLRRYPSFDSSRSIRDRMSATSSRSAGVSSTNAAPVSTVRRAGMKKDEILGTGSTYSSTARPTSMMNSLHASSPQISASSRKKQPVHPLVSPRHALKKKTSVDMPISRRTGDNDRGGKVKSCPPKKNKSMPPTVLLTTDDDPPPKKSTRSVTKTNNREKKKVKDGPPIKNQSMPPSAALLIDALPPKKNTRKKLRDSPPKTKKSTPPSAFVVTGAIHGTP